MLRRKIAIVALLLPVLASMTAAVAHGRPVFETRQTFVGTEDGFLIAVREKFREDGIRKVPVLLVHGAWVDSRVWDFPGRSVMDHLAARGAP